MKLQLIAPLYFFMALWFLALTACSPKNSSLVDSMRSAGTMRAATLSSTTGHTYSVNANGSGNFTTIQACANAAVAGDMCVIYAGSYSGWTQPVSGSSGLPITFIANPGDSVTINGGIVIDGKSYIRISGFAILNGSGDGVHGNGSTSHNQIDHNSITSGSAAFRINDGQGSSGSDNVFSFNNVFCSTTGNCLGLYLYGDRNRVENNTFTSTDGDCMDLGGTNVVVRNNLCKNLDGAVSAQHIDFIQVMGGGTSPTLSFSLVENNVEQSCTNDGGNCHFIIVRTGTGPVADTIIVRYNYAQNLNGSGASFGGVGDNVPNPTFYNNTIATEAKNAENGDCASLQNAPNGVNINNICYNVEAGGYWPLDGSAPPNNGNLAFTTGYGGSWNAPYSQETTYSLLANKNPMFANYPADGTLSSGSPAIGAGVALTAATNSGSSSVTLTVGNSHFFQGGWAGVPGDWIRIGSSTVVEISSINYSTNTISLATPVSWSSGAGIFLYKDTNGRVLINNGNPDVGAFPYGASTVTPTPTPVPTVQSPTPTPVPTVQSPTPTPAPVVSSGSVTLSPTSLSFGSQTVNTTTTKSITITNSTSSSVAVSGNVTGSGFGFGGSGTCSSTLGAGASCVVVIGFTPTATGTMSGTYTLTYGTSNATISSSLSGSGVSSSLSPTPTPTPVPVPTPTPAPVVQSPTPTPTPTSVSSGTLTGTSTWQSKALYGETGIFTIDFNAVPNNSLMDGIIGVSQNIAASYTDLAAIVRFNNSGFIDARSGSSYTALSSIPYVAGHSYHFQMVINVPAHTYSAYVTPSGSSQVTIGTNLAFRTEQASVTSLAYLDTYAGSGTFSVSGVAESLTSSTTWKNEAFASQTGSFTIQFDTVPNYNLMDAVTGLSQNAAASYDDLAASVRFNNTGFIDARNGASYTALSSVPYQAGVKYHVVMAINVSAHTYSVYVTPSGSSQITLASNFAFRTTQASVTSLSRLNVLASSGSHIVTAAP